MSPITQIMYFKTTAAYIQNPEQLVSKLSSKSSDKIDGLIEAYLGFETEDPSNAFWIFEWACKSAHDTYHQSESFKSAQTTFREVITEKPDHTLVQFSNTKSIFSAPVTEFVTFTLKSDVTMDKLELLVERLEAKLQEGTPKFYGSSWAPVIDKPNEYHGVLGWESVQAHWDAVSSGPLKEIIDEVKEVADLWLVHGILSPHKV